MATLTKPRVIVTQADSNTQQTNLENQDDSQGQGQNSHHDSWKGVADDEDGAENSEKLEGSFKQLIVSLVYSVDHIYSSLLDYHIDVLVSF